MREDLIVELAAWGFDENPERPIAIAQQGAEHAGKILSFLSEWNAPDAVLETVPAQMQAALARAAERDDVQAEFDGLVWRVGVVDLRKVVSFQRRVTLRPENHEAENFVDWGKRIDLAFPPGRSSSFTQNLHRNVLTLSSENPDLALRFQTTSTKTESFGLSVYHGSPFMEVGRYRGRCFLRDGYHRAYRLLKAGVFEMPAVIVEARTLQELGADNPWFFPEETLFSRRPPLVSDFLRSDLVVRWHRPARRKVIRVTIGEDFEPPCPETEGADHEYCNQAR